MINIARSKPFAIISLLSLISVISVVAISSSSDSEESKSAVFKCLNEWIDDPDMDGSTRAWRKRLSSEAKEHFRTSSCLRQEVMRDRPGAVELAKELHSWNLFVDENNRSDLVRMVATLIRFPGDGQLEKYLESNSVPLGEVHSEGTYERAVLAEDFILSRGNGVKFDAETGMFPNQHHELMKSLTSTSGLSEASFTEIAPKDYDNRDENYVLKASINGKLYETQARHFGDWYDYVAVVSFLNEISADQDLDERYVMLHTGDQVVNVWITEPKVVAKLLSEGLLRLGTENQALEDGLSFEESMLKLLK